MIEEYNESAVMPIINYMKSKGLNDNGIAGLLGNLYAESRLYPNNLQNSYNKKLNMTDEVYTSAVNDGTYKNFCTDRAGYSLAQWTSQGRKQGYYNYVKSKGVSIDDLMTAIEYVYIELSTGYKKILKELCSPTNSVKSCAEIVVCKYEVPASVLENEISRQATVNKRTAYAQDFYDKYLATSTPVAPVSEFSIPQIFLTNNDCYKDDYHMVPQGIVVHSTGCDNPNIKRYVQPDDGIIGLNTNNNDWNHPGVNKCVSAFVGKDKFGNVTGRQTLPWNICTWGCSRGAKGSFNYPASSKYPNDVPYIQFEICEDSLNDAVYFSKAFNYAAELCAYLCKNYNISVKNIVSHKEAASMGMASNHGDPENWLSKFGKDMNWFRGLVDEKINNKPEPIPVPTPTPTPTPQPSNIKIDSAKSLDKDLAGDYIATTNLNMRSGAGVVKPRVVLLPKGTKVHCYGYYTLYLGAKWLLVQTTINGVKYTGFCSKTYLKEV